MECIKVDGNDYDHRTHPATLVRKTSQVFGAKAKVSGKYIFEDNGMRVVSTIFVCLMALVGFLCGSCDGVSEVASNVHRRFRNRLPSRSYPGEDFIVEDEDSVELNKRQLFDDYGHMRFGKRDRFDDYGHMRFGRNHD